MEGSPYQCASTLSGSAQLLGLMPFLSFCQPVSSKGADDPADIWTLSCQELQVFHSPLLLLHSPSDVVCLDREGKTLWRGVCCPYHHPMFRLSRKEHRQDVVEGLLVIPYAAQLRNCLAHGFFLDSRSCFGTFGLFTSIFHLVHLKRTTWPVILPQGFSAGSVWPQPCISDQS